MVEQKRSQRWEIYLWKSPKKVQQRLREELKKADQQIENGDTQNPPSWVKPHHKDPKGGYRISDSNLPQVQKQPSILENRELAVALGKAVRRITQEIVAANTHSLDLSAISIDILEKPTSKELAQVLGISVTNAFNDTNVNVVQNRSFKMERLNQDIVISNFSGGEKLAVINTVNNTIAMYRPLSSEQMDSLNEKLEKARTTVMADSAQNDVAQGRSNRQIEMG